MSRLHRGSSVSKPTFEQPQAWCPQGNSGCAVLCVSDIKVILNWQSGGLFYSKFTNISPGYKPVKTCRELSHRHHCEALHQLRSLSQSRSPELSLAPAPPPPCPSLAVLVLSLSLLPVSGSWQLVSITVIPPALSCVRPMVQQKVTQQHSVTRQRHY